MGRLLQCLKVDLHRSGLCCSEAEDVTSMESWLTGCLLSVFIVALKEVRAMEGSSSDGFLIMSTKDKYSYLLGLPSSSNMLLLQQCAW